MRAGLRVTGDRVGARVGEGERLSNTVGKLVGMRVGIKVVGGYVGENVVG
jgi:hypothetical protein